MNDKFWHIIVLLNLFLYGTFLIIESLVDVWPTEQLHRTVQLVGGVAMLVWVVRYFVKGPKVVVYVMNTFATTVVIGLFILMSTLAVIALT